MNWINLIESILARGETYNSIAEYVGDITPASIRALRRNVGQEPSWRTGNKIIALYRKVARRKINKER